MPNDPVPPDPKDLNPVARAEVSQDEITLAYTVPAYQADKFIITMTAQGVRMAFGEVNQNYGKVPLEDALKFRTAVTISQLDAIALHRVLREVMRPIEKNFIDQGVIPPEQA